MRGEIAKLREDMRHAAEELRFEEAAGMRDRLRELEELEEEGFNLRFQHTLGQLSNPIRLREIRRDVARVRTLMKENAAASAATEQAE